MNNLSQRIEELVTKRERLGLLRDQNQRPIDGPQTACISINGKNFLNFASNGYLGISTHPKVVQAFKDELDISGSSSSASRLVTGNSPVIQSLESELANFKGTEAALLMTNGYQANFGVLEAIGRLYRSTNERLIIFSDQLNHASIIDGCRQSGAEVVIYPHRDTVFLEKALIAHEGANKLIVTESRFSMDGDIAPLDALVQLKQKYDAGLVVDEAHATGIDGNGRGLVHKFGVTAQTDVIVGTLGKAFGTHGAFIAANATTISWLSNFARTFVYSTALPSAVAAATRASLRVIIDERPFELLEQNVIYLREALDKANLGFLISRDADGPILPIVVGTPKRALAIQSYLETRGILVVAIRPPTVPEGTSRIRLSLRADHTREHLDRLVRTLSEFTDDS